MTRALIKTGSLYLLSEVPYRIAWDWQQQLVADYKHSLKHFSEDPVGDLLILLQHSSVYTLGHGADTRFLQFDPTQSAVEVHRVERGGEVTYHCPGQLVGYPILNLHNHRLDLHWYLRQLEEVIIRTLACFDLVGARVAGLTGVWLEGRKVAAIGIKVSQWITMHGFALNVCPDLAGFEKIVPCGIEGKPVGSLAQFLPTISLAEVRGCLVEQFEQVFGMTLERAALPEALIPFGD
ncbi:MAG: lipoyl(octanoyl) transferase LipB [Phormidesmis sp.]